MNDGDGTDPVVGIRTCKSETASPRRQHFFRWRLMLIGSSVRNCITTAFWRLVHTSCA